MGWREKPLAPPKTKLVGCKEGDLFQMLDRDIFQFLELLLEISIGHA
jgi:hypothetical protein